MARILVNAVSAKSGGAAAYIKNLIGTIGHRDSSNEYVFYIPSQIKVGPTIGNIRTVKCDVALQRSWRRFLWDQFVLRRIIKQNKIDVLLSSSDFGMFFPPCRQLLLLRNGLFFSEMYMKNFVTKKRIAARIDIRFRRLLVMLSAYFSDLVMTASEHMLAEARNFIRVGKSREMVNPFGVPLDRFKPREYTESNGKIFQLVFISEYNDSKNLTVLLKAVLLLRERGIFDFSLLTTADPHQFPEVEVVNRQADIQLLSLPLLRGCISVIEPVAYEKVPELYLMGDIFVFPSFVESFGHPLVEAMASGLPIVASDIPICHEICGDAAVYFDPFDAEQLAERILQLKNNDEMRRTLMRLGRDRVKERFDWQSHVDRLICALYQLSGASA